MTSASIDTCKSNKIVICPLSGLTHYMVMPISWLMCSIVFVLATKLSYVIKQTVFFEMNKIAELIENENDNKYNYCQWSNVRGKERV